MKIHIPAGFHLGMLGNQTGIGDKYYNLLAARRIPFVIVAADQFPEEAQALAAADRQTRHFIGYRRTGRVGSAARDVPPSGDPNVPRWGIPAQQASDEHWAWHTAADVLPTEYDGSVTYLITVNEPNKDNDDYVEWLADVEYYSCLKALATGFRYGVFGWAGANPEPRHWQGPNMTRLLDLLEQNPGKLALIVHEYSWVISSIWDGKKDGIYYRVGRAHQYLLSQRPNLPFAITEFGWSESEAPGATQAVRETREVAELYVKYPYFLGMAIWYLGGGYNNICNTVNTYILPITNEIINNPIIVDDIITPPPPPPPPPENDVTFFSFEDGWQDDPLQPDRRQIPNGFSLEIIKSGTPLPYGNANATGEVEAMHRLNGQLPPDEQRGGENALVLDGEHTYKIQAVRMATGTSLIKRFATTNPVEVSVPVQCHYQAPDSYNRVPPLESEDVYAVLLLNGEEAARLQFPELRDRTWMVLEGTAVPLNGIVTVELRFVTKWQNSRDLWTDLWRVIETPADPPPSTNDGRPRVQYARVGYVVPQDIALPRYLEIALAAFAQNRTVGFSYDDAGIGALENKTAVLFGIPDNIKQTFISWYATYYPGTLVEFRPFPSTVEFTYRPCDTERITQVFGANPDDYAQFDLPGHEGIDYGVAQGWPYYAVASGTVVHASDRLWSNAAVTSSYGWHVVIDHGDYCTVYAHAQAPLPVYVGQTVAAGTKVGLSGNTGNSHGYHLHFGLLDKSGAIDPDNGYPNWRHGRPVNPAPFLDGLLPPPQTPAGNARLGLHASADPGDLYGRTAEVNEFKELAAAANGRSVVKILSAHSVTAINQLVTAVPNAYWIVRSFMHFGDRVITPFQFIDDTINDTRRTVDALTNRGVPAANIIIELHNEPNLKDEGWGSSWANGAQFGDWILDVLLAYRTALPTVRYMYPGLSPGGDVTGVRTDSTRFLNDSAIAISGFDALAAHCYWSSGWPMSTALSHLDSHQKFNKPLWVTEASRNDRPSAVPISQYASEYHTFWQECRKRPLVQGVTYFVASASNGYFAPECWIVSNKSRGIAAEIKRITGTQNG